MRFKFYYSLALLFPLMLTGCEQPAGHQVVATVNYTQLLEKSASAAQEAKRNQEVKAVLLKAEDSAKTSYEKMNKEDAMRSQQVDARTLNMQWAVQQRMTREKTIQALNKYIEEYRKKNDIAVVIEKNTILAADPTLDITSELIESVKEIKIDYGALPEVEVKNKINDRK